MKMKKTSLNTTKVTDRKIKRLYLVAATVVAAAFVMAMPAFADDPLATINNLSDFVFSAIKAIGAILLGFGIVQIGLALKGHDASQRAQGFMTESRHWLPAEFHLGPQRGQGAGALAAGKYVAAFLFVRIGKQHAVFPTQKLAGRPRGH